MAIELKEISLSYGKKVILNNFNYNFETGKVHCVLGQSGCGKTTLLRIISGLQKPTKGIANYNNKRILKPNDEIFMMHQAYTNFSWKNCLDNVLFPIKLKRRPTLKDIENAKLMLQKVGLQDSFLKFPEELSGGMKQRLALARILMSKPPVILMDEPLSALDDKTRGEMQNLIIQMHKETKNTILMVTHSIIDAQKMGDNIINL